MTSLLPDAGSANGGSQSPTRFPSAATVARLCTTAPEDWRVLVLETAAPLGGVAAARGPRVLAERAFPQPQTQARHLSRLMAAVLDEAGWSAREIDVVLVDRGPGSHTGVRLGLVAARLFAWQTGAAARGVVALDALAREAIARTPDDAPLIALLPCRRGELYARRYAPGGLPLEPPHAVDVETLAQALTPATRLVGEGAHREREALGLKADDPRLVDEPRWPSPSSLLAAGFVDAVRQSFDARAWAESLSALYLHAPLARTLADRGRIPPGAQPLS